MGWAEDVKIRDPYNFVKSDDFFESIDNGSTKIHRPTRISYSESDQLMSDGTKNPACSHGRVFRFNDNSLLLIQFVRPKVWQIRFDPHNEKGEDFTDFNTRTIIKDTLSSLIKTLDTLEKVSWDVEVLEDPQYIVFQSVLNPNTPNRQVQLQIYIQRDPFQITVVRVLESQPPAEKLPELQKKAIHADKIDLPVSKGAQAAIIWKTRSKGLMYTERATVLAVEKSVTADFMGFGEQGGKHLFKKKTYMNYFNFDNMRYQNVYGKGPLDDREPLYHSEPFWIEVDSHPGYRSQVSTFIDNYSHICVDVGVKDAGEIRVATRFNSFRAIMVAGDSMQDLVSTYTSIVGKPRLKPRYVLGYHQACYGYDSQESVLESVAEYRKHDFPIDGMHIDVDMQDDYRTFTIDKREKHFPDPVNMFKTLREQGVKCSTNITPYISSMPKDSYNTLNEGLEKGHFIKDDRDLDPTAPNHWDHRYVGWSVGNQIFFNPNTQKPDYFEKDESKFEDTFNTQKPFHGGVFYGWGNGHPGHYPNLNNKDVRKWWGKQYQYLFECGLDFVWQDMTGPCISEEYGDMKGLPFRLNLDSDGWSKDSNNAIRKKAIEIWSLYSYNLHKATYHGLNNIHEVSKDLEWRKNRRNFIIGRGSFVGSHRYAGLWTGDNASTWEFLDISVAQVLALGMSGITISGQDVGGFEFVDSEHDFVNPELLIRWYSAYSLLPWFRNHYTKRRDWIDGPREGSMRKDGKLFQEPYAYQKHYEENGWKYQGRENMLYRAVLPVCKYLIRLRYSLMQLMYDAMFENMITGLPIARAMVITDDIDRSLFTADNQWYTRSQYMVRNDLLVAPALLQEKDRATRRLYLPYPDKWFPMNLRPDDLGVPLNKAANGGDHIEYDCRISADDAQIPYITPMYIREGGIIPKIQVRSYIPDPSLPAQDPNPITLHVYPGKDNDYEMFLDDGISRDSAPIDGHRPKANGKATDEKAANKYCKVLITQRSRPINDNTGVKYIRSIEIKSPFNGFGDLSSIVGKEYTIALWHETTVDINTPQVKSDNRLVNSRTDANARVTLVTLPVELAHTEKGVAFSLTYAEMQ
ncbi:glycosyl hydrolases family 31-domain-containing protein [Fusarium flagelliforme]|uniref:glycosyl hydrolases family 31-domain-containing protein n=1 Tax=Fusarium flagelliforme TaxID=2675880 RepID=UPI001E8CB7F5|nr:glycosyl hydrolases family 31-domain-containing protein [Fusarium flagelliforme]KAH7188137.1 glycosyl hydrolases family 31-domain-containing protein [Fusarium flagelliforme]